MANHRWIDESFSRFRKTERCNKCGVYRDWIGGDMQAWRYWHPDDFINCNIVNRPFTRPDCIGKLSQQETKTTKK